MYDFDRVIDRRGTDSVKYDTLGNRRPDTIPMFVADMDFAVLPQIRQALHKAVDREIYGYTVRSADYFEALAGWYARRYGWKLKPEWLVTTPGVVHALNIAVRAFTQPGDKVLLLTPVYGPFGNAIRGNGRIIADCPLCFENGQYTVDFVAMEETIVKESVKLFLLCSPHNPIGRVWTVDELKRMGQICLSHDVKIIVDEIHSDFVLPGYKYTNFAAMCPEFEQNSITCTAPSKTFNLAGLLNSNILIPSPELRATFCAEMGRSNTPGPTVFAYEATMAAYKYGDAWLDELLSYLEGNRDLVYEFCKDALPEAIFAKLEGTYLMWVDLSAYGTYDEVDTKLNDAGVWLCEDTSFCIEHQGFWRINIATPRAVLKEALVRMANALKK